MDTMDETCDETTTVAPDVVGVNGEAYRPRGYQLEMLEASLQQNIIVAVFGFRPMATMYLND
jgi:hypothetical protein